jgi:hypothetical protein
MMIGASPSEVDQEIETCHTSNLMRMKTNQIFKELNKIYSLRK